MEPNTARALELLEAELGGTAFLEHSRLVGDLMKRFAAMEGAEEGAWELAGLLHDLDVVRTKGDPNRDGVLASEMLDGLVPQGIREAVASHDRRTGLPLTSRMAIFLVIADILVNMTKQVPLEKLLGHTENGSVFETFSRYFQDNAPMLNGLRTVDTCVSEVGMTLPRLCEAVAAVRKAGADRSH